MANSKSDSNSTSSRKKSAKSSASQAKSFNPSTVRILGAVLMFIGLMLCVMLNSMMDLFVTVAALAALVVGFYLTVSGMRVLLSRNAKRTKQTGALWLIMGIMLIAAGVLGLLYRGAIATWVLVLVGAAIALFGLFMLIMLAVAQRGPRKIVLDVVLSVATMIVGVLIALLVLPAVGNAVNQLCYYLFGAFAIAIGAVELVMY